MSAEATGFLYPFLDREERGADALLADLAGNAEAKWAESVGLRNRTLAELDADLREAAGAMAERFAAGGRVFVFGNGGSATDAESIARLYADPPHGVPLPAQPLASEPAVITALANDVGFDVVFSRQLIAYARPGDMAIGISTSGNSRNVMAAFAEARKRGVLCIGVAGYDGGEMATAELDHCLVVRASSTHRIQETQTAVANELWRLVQEALPEGSDR
jgi:D-sedoheptulose 7-phosphate isomerase